MELLVKPDGSCKGVYSEEIDLFAIGDLDIKRASHVEPVENGFWVADLGPVGGPVLGPFWNRSRAIDAELAWLKEHLGEL